MIDVQEYSTYLDLMAQHRVTWEICGLLFFCSVCKMKIRRPDCSRAMLLYLSITLFQKTIPVHCLITLKRVHSNSFLISPPKDKKTFGNCRERKTIRNLNNQESFDFSSRQGWDDFYTTQEDKLDHNFEYEWHASISNDVIVDEIMKYHLPGGDQGDGSSSSSLFIGCGNSALPRHFYDSCKGRVTVTCQDYSKPCLDILQNLHGKDCPNMKFVQGDVTQLSDTFLNETFTTVVDKGLMDALMCCEDWSATVDKLIKELTAVLQERDGVYILISYKLAASTKAFLQDASSTLVWTFDIEGKSNDRVSVSIARMKKD